MHILGVIVSTVLTGELKTFVGQLVEFIKEHPEDEDWWEAKNENGETGYVPSTFVIVKKEHVCESMFQYLRGRAIMGGGRGEMCSLYFTFNFYISHSDIHVFMYKHSISSSFGQVTMLANLLTGTNSRGFRLTQVIKIFPEAFRAYVSSK